MSVNLYLNLNFLPILRCLLKSFCMIWDKVRHYICILTTYRVSIKSFPDYKTFITRTLRGHVGTLRCTSVRRILAVDNFPTRWCTSTLGFKFWSVFCCNIFKQVEWERWSDTLATTITGYHPLDFFLWRYVKDKVFSTPVPDITNLKARITDSIATVTEDMLENTWREIDYRLDVLRATKGAHVEVY